jgi:N-formylglutamate deformylase
MPSAAAVPDMIVVDRYGASAAPQLTLAAERTREMRAFTGGRNTPYAGGYTTHRYGRRGGAVQALQIEINRGLYLDEERVTRGPRFADVAARLADAMAALTATDLPRLMPLPAPPADLAAE